MKKTSTGNYVCFCCKYEGDLGSYPAVFAKSPVGFTAVEASLNIEYSLTNIRVCPSCGMAQFAVDSQLSAQLINGKKNHVNKMELFSHESPVSEVSTKENYYFSNEEWDNVRKAFIGIIGNTIYWTVGHKMFSGTVEISDMFLYFITDSSQYSLYKDEIKSFNLEEGPVMVIKKVDGKTLSVSTKENLIASRVSSGNQIQKTGLFNRGNSSTEVPSVATVADEWNKLLVEASKFPDVVFIKLQEGSVNSCVIMEDHRANALVAKLWSGINHFIFGDQVKSISFPEENSGSSIYTIEFTSGDEIYIAHKEVELW